MKKAALLAIFCGVFTILICITYFYLKKSNASSEQKNQNFSSKNIISTPVATPTAKPTEISIAAVGDMLLHNTVIAAAKNGDIYDFNPMFSEIKETISTFDFALCNLDGVMSGGQDYSGYPTFNAPISFANALKETGFDGTVVMNNHSLDRGQKGIFNTLNVLEQQNIIPFGVKRERNEKNYKIVDVKGIKIGLLAYSYETEPSLATVALNGIVANENVAPLLNVFYPSSYKSELLKMQSDIIAMKKECDIATMYIHWGDEYKRAPNEIQTQMSKKLCEYNVDVIFGDHPHTIQPYKKEKSENGNETHIFYSLGNFLSDQRNKPDGKGYTEDGMIAVINIIKNNQNNKTTVSGASYISTYVKRGQNSFSVLPVEKSIAAFANSNTELKENLMRSKRNTDEVMFEIEK